MQHRDAQSVWVSTGAGECNVGYLVCNTVLVLCVCVCMRASVCVCVCVCVRLCASM